MITLVEKVLKHFSKVKIKRAEVKIPEIKTLNKNQKNKSIKPNFDSKVPISSIINLMIKAALEEAKLSRKEKKEPEKKSYNQVKEEPNVAGGYGAVKSYTSGVVSSYTDYAKIFSYLGRFRARSAYQSMNDSNSQISGDKGFSVASAETMDKAAKHIRYFRQPGREFGVGAGAFDLLSLVPMGGMDAAEWTEFKLGFQLDQVMYYLKRKTA